MLDNRFVLCYYNIKIRKGKVRTMMNEILMMFGMAGIMFIPVILMFVICGANRKHKIGGAAVMVIIWIVYTFGTFYNFL